MITGEDYIEKVKTYFNYLVTEFGFSLIEEKVLGNAFYDVRYKGNGKVISISYENIADYFQVVIFRLSWWGKLPNYDDKTRTIHLNKCNEQISLKVSSDEVALNNEYFSKFTADNKLERKLLKSARDLRLCLKFSAKI